MFLRVLKSLMCFNRFQFYVLRVIFDIDDVQNEQARERERENLFSKILLARRTRVDMCQQTRYFLECIRDKYPICCSGARYRLLEK